MEIGRAKRGKETMKFLCRSMLNGSAATFKSPPLQIMLAMILSIIMLPYWPLALAGQQLERENRIHGDCPRWLKAVLDTVAFPRRRYRAWWVWIEQQ